jgi:serine/threonine-protein kinase
MIDGESAQTVAIKVLHPHLATNPEMVAMFLDEARVATRLCHPNLVQVVDMDMIGEELVIVMEYVEGGTLAKMQSALRQLGGRLPVGLTVRMVCDALEGLHFVHELLDENGGRLGLVHRDISPHNLLVGSDGLTRVTDFGIALAAGRLASTRPDGTLKGKLQYLAPEQIGRKVLDHRVDIFAAGIVLWECLTGEHLFQARTEAETVTRVLRDPISPPSMLRPEISTQLDEVCLRALERDPARRYRTAADFGRALREAFGGLPTPSQVGALVCELASDSIRAQRAALDREQHERAAAGGRRRRWLYAALAGLVLVGSAAGVGRRWVHARTAAGLSLMGAGPSVAVTPLRPANSEAPSPSPSAETGETHGVSVASAKGTDEASGLVPQVATERPTERNSPEPKGSAIAPKARAVSARAQSEPRPSTRSAGKAPFMPTDL